MIFEIRSMTIDHYDQVLALWQMVDGVGLSSADKRESIDHYLRRNPGLSWLAWNETLLVGAILCGHDGRRGYIHHLAVRPDHRRQGIGRQLVSHALSGLRQAGIEKCHLFVFRQNESAISFWRAQGFTGRSEISMMSIEMGDPT